MLLQDEKRLFHSVVIYGYIPLWLIVCLVCSFSLLFMLQSYTGCRIKIKKKRNISSLKVSVTRVWFCSILCSSTISIWHFVFLLKCKNIRIFPVLSIPGFRDAFRLSGFNSNHVTQVPIRTPIAILPSVIVTSTCLHLAFAYFCPQLSFTSGRKRMLSSIGNIDVWDEWDMYSTNQKTNKVESIYN